MYIRCTYFLAPTDGFSVTVVVAGNGTGNTSSNHGQSCLRFIWCNCLWERHESICSPSHLQLLINSTADQIF